MANPFEKAGSKSLTTGHPKEPAPEETTSENPTLSRIKRKRVSKPAMKTYSYYLRVDLAEKLTEIAQQNDSTTSALLNDILADVLK